MTDAENPQTPGSESGSGLEQPNSNSRQAPSSEFKFAERSPEPIVIGDTLSEGWSLVDGSKWIYFQVWVITLVVFFGSAIGSAILMGGTPGEESFITQLVMGLLGQIFGLAAVFIGASRARGESIRPTMIFDHVDNFVPIISTIIAIAVLTTLGYMLFILPGIYLSFAYYYAPMLVLDKGLGVWEAMETSRRRVTGSFLSLFVISLVLGIAFIIGMIPLFIGLLWVFPLAMNTFGVVYRKLFSDVPRALR